MCLFVPLKALLLHLLEVFNEHINDDDDDELKLGTVVVFDSLLKLIIHAEHVVHSAWILF